VFVPEWDGQVCSLGYDIVDWIEAYCCHGPGDVQGKPVVLDDEMASFVVRAYELDPRTGRRKIDRAMLSRPKGRAKSEVAGFVATAEGFGPVRFDGWDAAGQPVGRPVVSPLIKCLATEESQAGNTFENAAFIVCDYGRDAHPDVFGGASGVRQYQSATAIYLPRGGEMRASTSGSASKDGGKESFVVPDETHLYVHAELRSMYATVARNCGKRKEAEPWMLQTTTAYQEGLGSVAEQVLTAWKAGKLPNAAHWLVDHREAVGSVDLSNRRHTLEQLRYVYGAAAHWMDLDRIYRTMLDPTECETPEVAARYFLNLPSPADGANDVVIPGGMWVALADSESSPLDPVVFAVAVTPSQSAASICLSGRRTDGLAHIEVVDARAGTGWVVERLATLAARWRPASIVLDAGGPAGSLLPSLAERGVEVTKASTTDYAQACGAFYDAAKNGQFRHNSAPELADKLNKAVATGRKRPLLDRWAWTRKGSADITPLEAATLALWALPAHRTYDLLQSIG
jgi:2-polyprenyl-3-methyl-5-hydroxy-6-metoxy-1,4-benzoquinol methylase